ncbi:hypothetical protein MHBO_000936 [Bonamia ostreae]|uniref:GIY-YIG homing endonuclease n=1 Tax=Bonamia ostreae TaxID=126728 RepID=A0ABV2AHC8_9EUKA
MDNSNTYKDRLKLKKSTKTAVLGKVNDILRNRSLQTRIFRIQKSCISPVEIVLDFNVILTHCFRTSPLEEHTGFGRFIDIANAFTRSKMGFYIRTGYIHFMGEKYKFLNNQNCEEKCTLKGFLKEVRDNYILPKGWEGITTGFFTTCAGEYKYLAEKGIFSTSTTETIQIVYGSSKNTAKAIAASFARGFGANNVEDETLEFLMNKKHDEFRQVVIANQTVQTVCASEIEIYKRNPKAKEILILKKSLTTKLPGL